MKHVITCLITLLALTGCTAIRYGKSSNITLSSPTGMDRNVEIMVEGSQTDMAFHDVTLPFKMKVRHSELPLKVSVASPNNLYEDLMVNSKTVGKAAEKFWLVTDFLGLGTFIGGLIPILANPENDNPTLAMVTAAGAALTVVSSFAGMTSKRDVPQYKRYTLTSVDSTSLAEYTRLLQERPVVRYDKQTGNREVVQDNVIYTYKQNGEGGESCQLSTSEGIVVIPYERGYSSINKVKREDYIYYCVEKTVKGKTYYGVCDLMGTEMVVPQKKRPKVFGGIIFGRKISKPLVRMWEYTCLKSTGVEVGKNLNKAALALINENKVDEALNKLKWSIYIDGSEMNDAFYLLGHYYSFGTFGQEAMGGGLVERSGKKPLDADKGLEFLNMSLSSYTADVFADQTAWTYNPDKAVRLYAEYSGIIGDVEGESKKIAQVFQRDMDFDFDVEYYFHQKYSEMMNDPEYTKNVGNFIVFVPGRLDTIISIVDKIPHKHKSATLNLTELSNKELFYMGTKYFNEKQYGRAMYYFRRGAHCGDENGYSMSVITLDSIVRHYCKDASNMEVADAFSSTWPYPDFTGKFTQMESDFKNYYEQTYQALALEEQRRQEQEEMERQIEVRNQEIRRQRNLAIFGTILQGISQGVQSYYNVKASQQRSNVATHKSALDVEIPEAFNPQKVAAMCQPVYSYDSNGKMMISYPGFAKALQGMNTEIQRTANDVSGQLMATGDSYYMAKAYALQTEARLQNDINQVDMMIWNTPMYPEDRMALAQYDRKEQKDEEDGASGSSSKETGRGKESKSLERSSASTSTPKSSTTPNNRNQEQGDAKQQFHEGRVESSDYKEVKRNITLYFRDGDNAKAYLKNKTLYRKGASYYVEVDNKYYVVGYSNWGRFNRSILYGAHSVYFNM
ncbi:MAG: hypothetical protein J6B92_12460 [Paraprevotella sp.]|nr:hypothetical protein [Paraprevotella sp.]